MACVIQSQCDHWQQLFKCMSKSIQVDLSTKALMTMQADISQTPWKLKLPQAKLVLRASFYLASKGICWWRHWPQRLTRVIQNRWQLERSTAWKWSLPLRSKPSMNSLQENSVVFCHYLPNCYYLYHQRAWWFVKKKKNPKEKKEVTAWSSWNPSFNVWETGDRIRRQETRMAAKNMYVFRLRNSLQTWDPFRTMKGKSSKNAKY